MYSIRKSRDTTRRKKQKDIQKKEKCKNVNKHKNYKYQRRIKETWYEDFDYDYNCEYENVIRYISDDHNIRGGNYSNAMEFYISTGRNSEIQSEIYMGYSPDSSFGRNCWCCSYEHPDDLTRCFWDKNMEAFKVLFPMTNPELIIRDYDDNERGVKIYGEGAEPYLRIMSKSIDIPADYLLEYIGYHKSFNIDTLYILLDAIGKTEESINFKKIKITKYNKEYISYALITRKVDTERIMSSVIEQGGFADLDRRDALIEIGQLCINLGFETSKDMEFGICYWRIAREFSLPNYVEDERIYLISLDKLMIHINEYLSVNIKSKDSTMEFIKEIYTGGHYNKIIRIQCLFRVFKSKAIANYLRLLPENLFDPEFFSMRKKMLNINDSIFKI